MKTYILLFFIGISVLNLSCSPEFEKDASAKLKDFPVLKLSADSAEIFREYVGNVQATKNVEIYARVKGYLEQVYVDEGQYVKKGQPLFRINDEEYKSALSKAKAKLSYAIAEAKEMELEAERLRALAEKQVVSKTEYEVALSRLAAAKANIEEAQSSVAYASIQLNHTSIYAPFDGIIDGIPYKIGSLIDEGTKLTNLSDIKEVHVYFNVSEKEYLQYIKSSNRNQGKDVELILADGSMFKNTGMIETMEGQFNETTGSIAFRARFPNTEKVLKHGSTGTVRLTRTISKAIIIPQKACLEIQDKNFVFVMGQDHKVRMKSFVPKHRLNHSYIVESGLKSGDVIVCEGVQSIKDGMAIAPKFIDYSSQDFQTFNN